MILLVVRIFFFTCLPCCVHSLSTVIYGTACRELQLLTSKIAAQEGIDASCVCSSSGIDSSYRIMYGKDDDDDSKTKEIDSTMVKMVSSNEEIANALGNANSLVLIGYDTPINEEQLNLLVGAASSKLSKVVLLSKMGVTKAKGGGFFGGGGGDKKLVESENRIRELAQTDKLDLSIIRAGVLKGGGPGDDNSNGSGLSKSYYSTIGDLLEFNIAQGHDTFTLGIQDAVTTGDQMELPNMIQQMGTKSSFEPSPSDTNRVVVASSIVATLLLDRDDIASFPLEFSVGAARSEQLPTMDEWFATLSKLL